MTPRDYGLLTEYLPADYTDTFERELIGRNAVTPDMLIQAVFLHPPRWVGGLMKLRNVLVKPFGLKNDGLETHFTEMIRCRNDRETAFGMNDKHLCFYASAWCSEKTGDRQKIGVTTVVKYNNTLGKVYFFVIKPFHKLIIRSLLNRIDSQPE